MGEQIEAEPAVGSVHRVYIQIASKHGAWVSFGRHKGFIDLAEISERTIARATDVLSSGETINAKVIGRDDNGQYHMSARGVEQEAAFTARIEAKALRAAPPASANAAGAANGTAAAGTATDSVPPPDSSRADPSPTPREQPYRDRYAAARGVASTLAAIGWLEIAGGAVVALISIGMMRELGPFGLLGLVPGIMLAAFGLLQVAFGQVAQAAIDSANHTGEMLEIMRRQAALRG